MEGVAIPQPRWLLTYQNRDITAAIEPFVLSVEYTDNLHGKSDELVVTLDDSDGRWRGIWAPQKKDRLGLRFGYADGPMQDAGGFEIDEIEYKGPPHTVHLKALAAGIAPSLRTDKSAGYEGMSLRQIADQVARRHGLTVQGDIADLRLGRLTQNHETDLTFLRRVAEDFGHAFTVRDKKLVFHQIVDLKSRPSILRISRFAMIDYNLKANTLGKVAGVSLTYHDPMRKGLVRADIKAAGSPTGDTLRLTDRAPDPATARARAEAALERANRGSDGEGSITIPGNPGVAAGCRVEVADLDRLDGLYLVETVKHKMDRAGGYLTSLEVKAG